MPELPEVESAKNTIQPLVGRTLKNIIIHQPVLREAVSPLIQTLIGQTLNQIDRRSKYLIFRTKKGDILFHFGMSGYFSLIDQDKKSEPSIHDRAEFFFDDWVLRFNDVRRFGLIQFHPNAYESKQLTQLAIEPLSPEFEPNYLKAKLHNSKSTIKQSLMNSSVVVGVGNIYAAEILFLSGIHPKRIGSQIKRKDCEKITHNTKKVLSEAIELGGTTIRDFKNADGKIGYFKQKLNVYGQEDKPCKVCQKPIRRIKIANRSSFYCDHCQK